MQAQTPPNPRDFIDLERYPVDAPDTAGGRAVVTRYVATLRDEGMCRLDGFLRPAAVTQLCGEAERFAAGANYALKQCNPYFTRKDPAYPDDHARNIMTPRCLGMVAGDLIAADSGLQRLYRWEPLRRFLSAILGAGEVHVLADPYQCLNISVIPDGPGHNWHFDDGDFVVTLMLRKPESGGAFECVPGIRTPEDENFEAVRAVLLGGREGVRVVPFEPGTLMIFRGRYTLHRVAPVQGQRPRLIAVLSYSTEADYYGSALANRLVYGERVAGA